MVKKPQFSLRVMLTLVAVIAIICEALIRPSAMWFVVIATASLGCIMFAVLAAVYGSGLVRAFWLGFAIASLGQLGMEKLANSRRGMPTE
jgi:CHASE2 domain-containing sensor protein